MSNTPPVTPELPQIEDVLLKQLSQGEITTHADMIVKSISVAYGKWANPTLTTNIFGEVRSGKLQCWALLGRHQGKTHMLGFITTRILNDARRGRKSLYIEHIEAVGGLSLDGWTKAFPILVKHAKENGCSVIEGDLINKRMYKIAREMGFKSMFVRVLREI